MRDNLVIQFTVNESPNGNVSADLPVLHGRVGK